MALTTVRPQGMGFNTGRRNLIINGAMQVAQRGTSSTSTGYQTTDRFTFNMSNFDNAAFTQVQSTAAPSGFSSSWRIDCTTVETALAADEYSNFAQPIEAQNLQNIQNGTSGAKSLTLSFYVKSNKTGTFGVNLYKPDNTGRQITATYQVSSADTWEFKTITFAGDTAGGGIDNDNGAGFYIYWHLAAGTNFTSSDSTSWSNYANAGFAFGHAVNIFDNTANDWAITGVQLEVGENASDFEHRSFGEELVLCQRYYSQFDDTNGGWIAGGFFYNTTAVEAAVRLPQPMRAAPTVSIGGTESHIVIQRAATSNAGAGSTVFNQATTVAYNLSTTADGSSTTGNGTNLRVQNTAILKHDAEL